MATPYLSQFKSLIGLKSAYRGFLAFLALAVPVFLGFTFVPLVVAAAGAIAAYFHAAPAERPRKTLWFLSALVFLGFEWRIQEISTFFDFIGIPQLVFFAAEAAFLVLVFSLPQTKARQASDVAGNALLFLVSLFAFSFLSDYPVLVYGTVFGGALLLAPEIFRISYAESRKKAFVYGVWSGYIASQVSFLISFLPFTPLGKAAIVASAVVLFAEAFADYREGNLKVRRLVTRGAGFIVLCAIIGVWSSWTL
jgi:hypothetical protein